MEALYVAVALTFSSTIIIVELASTGGSPSWPGTSSRAKP
jgi:hypothetical protein